MNTNSQLHTYFTKKRTGDPRVKSILLTGKPRRITTLNWFLFCDLLYLCCNMGPDFFYIGNTFTHSILNFSLLICLYTFISFISLYLFFYLRSIHFSLPSFPSKQEFLNGSPGIIIHTIIIFITSSLI